MNDARLMRRLTLEFDIEECYLDAADDTKDAAEGITVKSVAAWLCSKHDARDGYIRFSVQETT